MTIKITSDVLVDVIRNACAKTGHDPLRDITGIFGLRMVEDTVHASDALSPNGRMFAVSLVGAEHDYSFTLRMEYENEAESEPSCFAPVRQAEWADAAVAAMEVPESEAVRFIVVAWRMPDFSVQVCSLEADGVFHDSISAPLFSSPLNTTMYVPEPAVQFCSTLGRRYWGKAWEPLRCHHNKQVPPGALQMEMEVDDCDDPDHHHDGE